MKKGLVGTDDYLQNWKKKKFPSTEKTAKQIVLELSKHFESKYDDIKLKSLNALE